MNFLIKIMSNKTIPFQNAIYTITVTNNITKTTSIVNTEIITKTISETIISTEKTEDNEGIILRKDYYIMSIISICLSFLSLIIIIIVLIFLIKKNDNKNKIKEKSIISGPILRHTSLNNKNYTRFK